VEVFEDGVIEEILVPVGERVPVGTPIARIGSADAEPAPEPIASASGNGHGNAAPVQPAPEPTIALSEPSSAPVTHPRVSPLARRTAAALGVDLSAVEGTGPRGAVTQVDVERAAGPVEVERAPAPAQPPAAPAPDRQAAMREAIAQLMARSKREIPHYYLSLDIDMTAALELLRRRNEERPVAERVLPAVLLARAAALAAREIPDMNGFFTDGAFRPSDAVHLGFAVALRSGGLIAPAIHNADGRSLDELMRDARDLVKRVRSGGLRASEMSDPTITVTSLGERGVGAVYGVIYPPQVALVGFGRIAERPWAADGMVGAREVVTATLSADHRASDGHTGALFLAAVDANLQTPEEL
jgi:pyruvate dehydrogenase E2 component (dihydrolipoamide acetyltransferase)